VRDASIVVKKKGFVLIAVLAITGIITALAVGFIYTVQTSTSLLSSFADSTKAYSMAKSALLVGLGELKAKVNSKDYNGRLPEEIAVKNPYPLREDLVVKIEDESGKFNLNSLVFPSGANNPEAVSDLKRLLEHLNLSVGIAEKIAAWAKIVSFESTDVLLLIPGITIRDFSVLDPYVTVYGDAMVNINSADLPVLMSLSPKITETMAKQIKSFRRSSPFLRTSDVVKVPGFSSLGVDLIGKISINSIFFKLKIKVSYKGIKKEVWVIAKNRANRMIVESWREI